MMSLTRFAKEHGLNPAAGTQRFFHQTHTLDADKAIFRWQAAAESYAEFFQPAIVPAGQQRGFTCSACISGGFSCCSHYVERSKLLAGDANALRLLLTKCDNLPN